MRRLLFTCLRVHQAFSQSYAVCGIIAHGCQGSAKCPAHMQVPHTLADTTWEAEEEGYVRHLLSICDRFAPGTTDLVRISLMREPSVRCEAASLKQAASTWNLCTTQACLLPRMLVCLCHPSVHKLACSCTPSGPHSMRPNACSCHVCLLDIRTVLWRPFGRARAHPPGMQLSTTVA